MPVIPDAQSTFGARPVPQSARGVVGYVAGQEAKAAIQGGEQLQQTGREIQKVGADGADKQAQLDVAAAKSQYLTDMVDLQNGLDDDPDYTTHEQKFREGEAVIRQRALGLVGNGDQQQLLAYGFNDDATRMLAGVKTNMRTKSRDATRGFVTASEDKNKAAALAAKDPVIAGSIISAQNKTYDDAYKSGAYTAEEIAKKKVEFGSSYGIDWINQQPDDVKLKLINQRMGVPAAAATPKNTPGMIEKGNIDLSGRPIVDNADGSKSTVLSFSINSDGKEVLIPQVVGGKVLSQDDAIKHFKETGENLGKFDTPANADAYAQQLHEQEADRIKGYTGTGAQGPGAPLSVRNNNPGNIRGADGNFKVFDNPQAGIDAMRSDLMTKISGNSQAMKAKLGGGGYIPSLRNVISVWAPNKENDTEAYIKRVSSETGIDPDQPLVAADLDKVVPSMIGVEGGGKAAKYFSGTDPMGPQIPRGKTFSPVDFIDPDKISTLKNQVESDIRQKQILYRGDLEQRVQDANAMALSGVQNPQPLTLEDFNAGYGEKGAEKFAEYQTGQVFASDVNRVQTMKPVDQMDLLNGVKPTPGLGYNIQQKRYEVLAKAIATVNQDRQTDPASYAIRAKMLPDTPLNFNDPQALAGQISKQASVIKAMQPEYNTPLIPLTKPQAEQMSALFRTMPAENRLNFLKSMSQNLTDPDQYNAVMSQVRPKSPTTALAGAYVGYKGTITDKTLTDPTTVATRLLKGEDLINPPSKDGEAAQSKFKMPENAGTGETIQSLFDDKTKGIFRGNSDEALRALDSVKAYYAALSAEAGDFSGQWNSSDSTKRLDQAIKDVVGNMVDITGKGKVVAPYGMGESEFKDQAQYAFNKALDAAGLDKAKWSLNNVTLVNDTQPGVYKVFNGSNPLIGADHSGIKINVASPQYSDAVVDSTASDASLTAERKARYEQTRAMAEAQPVNTRAARDKALSDKLTEIGGEPDSTQGKTPVLNQTSVTDDQKKNLIDQHENGSIVPVNVRAFVKSIVGDNKQIDENFFKKSELDVLRKAVLNAGTDAKNIDYNNYDEKDWSNWLDVKRGAKSALMPTLNSPAFRAMTTIGGARIHKNENGDIILTDKYDFNTPGSEVFTPGKKPSNFENIKASYKDGGLYGAMREIGYLTSADGSWEGKKGRGYKVVVNLGNPKDWKK